MGFPFRDYIPALGRFVASLGGSDFTPGEKYTVFEHPKGKFSVVICFEDIFPKFQRKMTKKGAEFLVVITNDGWTNFVTAHLLHFMFTPFSAIENRRYVVRAGNSGLTCIIDEYGRVRESIPLFERGHLVGDVKIIKKKSIYTRFGDYFVILMLILVIKGIILAFIKKRDQLIPVPSMENGGKRKKKTK